MLLFIIQHLAAFVAMILMSFVAGTAVTRRRFPVATRSVIGLAVAGHVLVLLALAGALNAIMMCSLAAVALLAGARHLDWGSLVARPARYLWALLVLPAFVLCLYPSIAFDETLYHLPFIDSLARSGLIQFLPTVRYPIFPQLHEALCVPVFLVLGPSSTHLVSLLECVLLAAVLSEWLPGRGGILAAAVFISSPIVVHLSTITYTDMAVALFVATAYSCLERASGSTSGAVVAAAALLLGTACSVKYDALYFAAAGFCWLLLRAHLRRHALLFTLVLLGTTLPMYAEIYARSGNPVFPFFSSLFGHTAWSFPPESHSAPVMRALTLFWDVTFARIRVNQQPPYSPLFAVAFAIVLVRAKNDFWSRHLVIVTLGYVMLFMTVMSRDSRYLLPLFALFAVELARALVRWPRVTAVLTIACVGLSLAYAGFRFTRLGKLTLDDRDRTRFVEAHVPSYRALRARSAGRVYGCGVEHLQYYAGGKLVGDSFGPYASDSMFRPTDSRAIARTLSQIGVTQVLLSRRSCSATQQALVRPPWFTLVYSDDDATLWRLSGVSSPAPP